MSASRYLRLRLRVCVGVWRCGCVYRCRRSCVCVYGGAGGMTELDKCRGAGASSSSAAAGFICIRMKPTYDLLGCRSKQQQRSASCPPTPTTRRALLRRSSTSSLLHPLRVSSTLVPANSNITGTKVLQKGRGGWGVLLICSRATTRMCRSTRVARCAT